MQLKIIDQEKKETGKISLPRQFEEEIRPDLIRRAYLALKSHERQKYGTKPGDGTRQSVEVSRRRRDYRGSYGIGISRIPRKVMLRRGTRFNWTGAFAPMAVGGRSAFPPLADKIWAQKINTQEKHKSTRSALAATLDKNLVEKSHRLPTEYPFVISSSFERLDKTRELKKALIAIGLKDELSRISEKKVRAGKGKMRGRKYQYKKGPLIVVSPDCRLLKSGTNIQGLDIADVKHLNIMDLAPSGNGGRLTLFTEDALKKMDKERLFI